MLELVAALSWLELIVAGLSILAVVGGLMNRAFIKPLKEDIDSLKDDHKDQEIRLRVVEKIQVEHGVEISTVKDLTMKLVDRMDKLIAHFAKSDK